MSRPTFFGEINELHSRAVWYSDEEDEDSDGDMKEIKVSCREKEIANTEIEFRLIEAEQICLNRVTTCVISVSEPGRQISRKDTEQLNHLATLNSRGLPQPVVGHVYSFKLNESNELLLWLVIDSAHPYVIGHNVGHLAVSIVSSLSSRLSDLTRIIILSQQFSPYEYLLHLVNSSDALNFFKPESRSMLPPVFIKNHFEASVFEFCTINSLSCAVFCLPDPKCHPFDHTKSCPFIPKHIVDHRLNYNKLDRSYIFI